MPSKPLLPQCAACTLDVHDRVCFSADGKPGKACPTLTQQDLLAQANAIYEEQDLMEFARQASIQEAECYAGREVQPYTMQPTKPRIVEICEFARRMGYKRLGLAFCVGLSREAGLAAEVFQEWGLEVASVCCKAGRTSKEGFLGLGEEDKINRGTDEAMCNPVFQAKALAAAGAELNVLLGLCVGHDSMFIAATQTPTTVLAVKDRVYGHNPLAALYTSWTYSRRIKKPDMW